MSFYGTCAKSKDGGGLLGAIISKVLANMFGKIGAYVIIIAFIAILLMFITEKLLFASLGKHSSKTLASMKKMYQDNREFEKETVEEDASFQDQGWFHQKRKAKTFTFSKDNQPVISPSETASTKEPIPQPKVMKPMTSEMEEIDSNNLEFSIHRAADYSNGTENNFDIPPIPFDVEAKPIYEKELKNKFNKDYDISKLADNVESLERQVQQPEFDIQQEQTDFENMDQSTHITEKPSQTKKKKSTVEDTTISITPVEIKKDYQFPPIDLLSKPKGNAKGMSDRELKETAMKLQSTLESFGVRVSITNISCGPSVTRYELQPEQGVKVSRITNLADDIKLNLAAADVRIEAPIPGKAAVGIEVPNKENSAVMFRELIESTEFKNHSSDIAFAVGRDIGGQTVVTDIAKMPHLLIAGATGSGKSVCINTIIMSILYKSNPADVKLIMVDPKVVELSVYNGIPHLLIPVVTDPKKASAALNWAVMEMTDRYKKFADLGVRDLKGYNKKVEKVEEYKNENYQKLPQIVIIVDELADLMMVAPGEVEDAICRLAQMARAAGLHLIIATQRPSVNVITGLIKANVPSRIAFSVSSAIDSRTIIDGSGAEKLLGKGDMLFFPSGYPKPVRVQGAFISDKEVGAVVEFLTTQNSDYKYSDEIEGKITSSQITEVSSASGSDRDDYFMEAGKFIIDKDKASIGMLQRVYKIGFNRAARIMDQLADAGVVGPEEGTKPRKILMSLEEFEQYIDEYV